MTAIRRLLAHRRLALLLCLATLALKLLVPTGYMVGSDGGRLTIELCSGAESSVVMAMAMPMPGPHADAATGHGEPRDHGRAEMPCAFSALSVAALGAVDALQLAALIAFIVAVGTTSPSAPRIGEHAHLRPPLRGPPARR